MKRFIIILGAVLIPVTLAACAPAKNANTNTVKLDLVNEAANVNTGTNTNPVANTNSLLANSNVNASTSSNQNTNASTTSAGQSVSVISSGYSPATVTVKAGTVVTWTNNSGGNIFIASDPHPTHTDLPALSSGTVANGGTYSFTFTQKGTWGYHDHLDPTTKGTVIVQ